MSDTVFIKDKKLCEVTPVDNAFILRFMPDAPEFALKVYLYGLMTVNCGTGSADIAAALGCTDEDLRAALSYWEAAGLVTVIAEEPLQVKFNSVREAVSGRYPTGDARYAELLKKLQAVLGTRMLTGSELAKIYDWIEVFGFEQDAAVMIVRRCLDKKGAKTSVAYMDAMAKRLAGRGAVTEEQVLEAIAEEDLLMSGAGAVLKRWHQTRPPTKDELALYEKWTKGWGFDDDSIITACGEMTSAEKPSFAYLDSILDSWRSGGTVTREDIRERQRLDDSVREIARVAFNRAGIKSTPTREQRLEIRAWIVDHAMSPELLYLAAELAQKSAKRFVVMRNLMNEWQEKGISAVSAAKAYYEAYQKFTNLNRTSGGTRRALDYNQGGTYSRDELRKLGINLGEEFYSDDDEQ